MNYEKKSLGGSDLEFCVPWDRFCLFGFNRSDSVRNCSFYFRLGYRCYLLQAHRGNGIKTLVLGMVCACCSVAGCHNLRSDEYSQQEHRAKRAEATGGEFITRNCWQFCRSTMPVGLVDNSLVCRAGFAMLDLQLVPQPIRGQAQSQSHPGAPENGSAVPRCLLLCLRTSKSHSLTPNIHRQSDILLW